MTRTFRLTAEAPHRQLVEDALAAQGFASRPLPFYPAGRELVDGLFPLGSSLAARFGYIYIQDASSMLPALALAGIIEADGREGPLLALDMCASPGGKTSLLALLLGARALVLANEPAPKRLANLRRNLELMNAFNTATISHQGQELPLPSAGSEDFAGFDYILLDPPCSGWGTVEKYPKVIDVWQGERLGPLAGLQRLLLREAARLLRPGGALVYSTCTSNVRENEEQVAWLLSELNAELGGALGLIPLEPFPGFIFDDPMPPLAGQGVLRVAQEGLGQGFFISALRKSPEAPVLAPRQPEQPAKGRTPERPRGTRAHALQLSRESLSSALCDMSLLPPGEITDQGGALYFRHAAGLAALPAAFAWWGFPLGKNIRINPALRGLMPPPGANALNMEGPAGVSALVSGQSLRFAAGESEVGLYLNGLPLCRLRARGGRVFI